MYADTYCLHITHQAKKKEVKTLNCSMVVSRLDLTRCFMYSARVKRSVTVCTSKSKTESKWCINR